MLCATGLLQAAADQSLFRFLCYYPLVFPIPNFLFLHICEHPIYKKEYIRFPINEGKKISCTNLSLFYYISTKKSSVFPLYVLTFMCKHATPPRFFWVSLTDLTKFNLILCFSALTPYILFHYSNSPIYFIEILILYFLPLNHVFPAARCIFRLLP